MAIPFKYIAILLRNNHVKPHCVADNWPEHLLKSDFRPCIAPRDRFQMCRATLGRILICWLKVALSTARPLAGKNRLHSLAAQQIDPRPLHNLLILRRVLCAMISGKIILSSRQVNISKLKGLNPAKIIKK